MYYLNVALMPDAVMPFVPMLTGLLGLACGVLFFFLSLVRANARSPIILRRQLAIGCPLLAFGFYFTTLSYGLGVALAATGAGHYAVTRWRWSSAAWAIACFAIAIGIYQSTVLLMPVLFGFYLVVQIIAVPHLRVGLLLRRCGVFLAVMLAACGLYRTDHDRDFARVPRASCDGVPARLSQLADGSASNGGRRSTRPSRCGKAYYTGNEILLPVRAQDRRRTVLGWRSPSLSCSCSRRRNRCP